MTQSDYYRRGHQGSKNVRVLQMGMADDPPTPPTPGRGPVPSEELEKLQETADDLSEMLGSMMADFDAKEAVTADLIPPEERAFAEDMTGSMVVTSTGTISYVVGYYGSSRRRSHTDTDKEHSREGVVGLVDVGPREDSNFGRGYGHGTFISKYEKPVTMASVNSIPGTGAPDPEDHENYAIKDIAGWKWDDRLEAYQQLHQSGAFDHLNVGGFDQQEELWDALPEHPDGEDSVSPVVDVFPNRGADSLPEVVVADDPSRV